MADPTFLGVDKSTWDIVNGLANWFAAFGSVAAAAVALYLANRSARPWSTPFAEESSSEDAESMKVRC
jgi:hypothetical protein